MAITGRGHLMLAIRTMHGAFASIIQMVAIGVVITAAKASLCDLFERNNYCFVVEEKRNSLNAIIKKMCIFADETNP